MVRSTLELASVDDCWVRALEDAEPLAGEPGVRPMQWVSRLLVVAPGAAPALMLGDSAAGDLRGFIDAVRSKFDVPVEGPQAGDAPFEACVAVVTPEG